MSQPVSTTNQMFNVPLLLFMIYSFNTPGIYS